MKVIAKILVLGAALAASAPFASAAPITGSIGFAGIGTYTGGATGTFTPSPAAGNNAAVLLPSTPGTTLAVFVAGTPAHFNAFTAGSIPVGTQLFTSTVGGTTLIFTYTSTSTSSVDQTGNGILLTGTLTETGSDPTMGTLDISANGGAAVFTAGVNTAATPEPSSLLLMGTGLIGAAGAVFRKRSLV